jgi:hypothetical protein
MALARPDLHYRSCAASDSEGHVIASGGKDIERFGWSILLKLNLPRGVDREFPVRDLRLNPVMVTRDNFSTRIFGIFLGITSGPGYHSFLPFRIFIFAVRASDGLA